MMKFLPLAGFWFLILFGWLAIFWFLRSIVRQKWTSDAYLILTTVLIGVVIAAKWVRMF